MQRRRHNHRVDAGRREAAGLGPGLAIAHQGMGAGGRELIGAGIGGDHGEVPGGQIKSGLAAAAAAVPHHGPGGQACGESV